MALEIIFLNSANKEIEEFPNEVKKELLELLLLLGKGYKLSMPFSRSLSGIHSSLHELRLKDQSGQFRIIYWIKTNSGIFIIHAFKKKTQQLPKKNIEIIFKRIKELK